MTRDWPSSGWNAGSFYKDNLKSYYKTIFGDQAGIEQWKQLFKDTKKSIPKPPDPEWIPIDQSDPRYGQKGWEDVTQAGGSWSHAPSSKIHDDLTYKKILEQTLQLYKGAKEEVKTWQEFVALNNYPPIIGGGAENVREDEYNNINEILDFPIPLDFMETGDVAAFIEDAKTKSAGSLSFAEPEGEEGTLSLADEPEEELEEISAMGAGAVTGAADEKRKIPEVAVNEALNYLLQISGEN